MENKSEQAITLSGEMDYGNYHITWLEDFYNSSWGPDEDGVVIDSLKRFIADWETYVNTDINTLSFMEVKLRERLQKIAKVEKR